MSEFGAPDGGDGDVVARVLADSGDSPRLHELLSAVARPPAAGPQPGEASALAAFRELVTEPAGVPSLAHRRRARLAAAAATSVVLVFGGGIAAATTGALPTGAQRVAHGVLGVVGIHVPPPSHGPGAAPARHHRAKKVHHRAHPTTTPTPHVAPTHPVHPTHPAHPTSTPTRGNSGSARQHGNPSPGPSSHPTPRHGKPTSAPTTSDAGSTKGQGSTNGHGVNSHSGTVRSHVTHAPHPSINS